MLDCGLTAYAWMREDGLHEAHALRVRDRYSLAFMQRWFKLTTRCTERVRKTLGKKRLSRGTARSGFVDRIAILLIWHMWSATCR